ncbi:NAD(P)/FAD-dependent oxidoreductase [Ginsengibacter hankyongi]|uniref:NAD(P)/FAD-dependent oxidoreductase n=1 Tax=Ginsengibacter hankyongi TaxID=2607284 RepID=A0A5J5IL41_9BACT|nr:NAD(P)/FAD-dependent oxidoreductase [Ginsengibacter hankyongi]KAA9041709.1 NAD(P)/FAD-dependent oxidoreductase [Ginsengibacter hankyongi]
MAEFNTNKSLHSGSKKFDVGIVGGGLAGLSLSTLLAKNNCKVILFEKEKYPFHRVCGEYISLESWKFIESLGLNLSELNLPIIKKLIVSSPNGTSIHANLDLGGFGISRFFIDNELKKIALENGVLVLDETKVSDVTFSDEFFNIKYKNETANCAVAVGSFGKRSNLDVKWSRDFIQKKPGKLNNYIGVKYHIKTSFPFDTIALHNFKNGYCGISKVEGDEYCLCYLTTAKNLKDNNSIKEMEQNVLYKNPFLKKIFTDAEFIFKEPVTISQISFDRKTLVENHVLMIGDAAGMITPLCGNGMSMALHSAKIASGNILAFFGRQISRDQMENRFVEKWTNTFEKRLRTGRTIQKLFGKEFTTNLFISMLKPFPALLNKIIKATHGQEF